MSSRSPSRLSDARLLRGKLIAPPPSQRRQSRSSFRHRIDQVVDPQSLRTRVIRNHSNVVDVVEGAWKFSFDHCKLPNEVHRRRGCEARDSTLLIAILLEAGNCNCTLNGYTGL